MGYRLYREATRVATPILTAWLRARPGHRLLLERFEPDVPLLDARPVWVHACSVGELGAAGPLAQAVHARWPDVPVVLTVSTASGNALAQKMAEEWLHVTWLPFDTVATVSRFLNALDPRGLVLMETELWPNLIVEARRREIPVVLVSGRLSAKHYRRYRRGMWLFKPVLERLSAVGAQTELYAERFQALGVPAARLRVTGNVKYDGAITEVSGVEALRERIGLAPDAHALVFGSTRPGDESLAVSVWERLNPRFPGLRLIVAPRHLQRLDDVLRAIGRPVARWSEVSARGRCEEAILVVDTMGDLIRFYALATVAVVGGSFYSGVEGHNPFEPAALGVPTVFGRYMANFAEPAAMLVEAGGAVQTRAPDELESCVAALLSDPIQRDAVGAAARAVVMQSRGAIGRTLDVVAEHVAL